MADRYLIKWSLGADEYPVEIRSTEQEAMACVRELFITHGPGLQVEICLNDLGAVLYGPKTLKDWNQGKARLP